jgi:hypothetical protein
MEVVKHKMEGVTSFLKRSNSGSGGLMSKTSGGLMSKVANALSGGESRQVKRNTQANQATLQRAELDDAEFHPMLRKVNSKIQLHLPDHTFSDGTPSPKSVTFLKSVEEICFEASSGVTSVEDAQKHCAMLEILGISPDHAASPDGAKDEVLEAVSECRCAARARIGSITLVPISPCEGSSPLILVEGRGDSPTRFIKRSASWGTDPLGPACSTNVPSRASTVEPRCIIDDDPAMDESCYSMDGPPAGAAMSSTDSSSSFQEYEA